jgi:hypothetical protein
LAKKISDYNVRAKKLTPFLTNNCCSHEIDSALDFKETMKQVRSYVEPTIVHIRSSGTEYSGAIKEEIKTKLVEEMGFIELSVNDLVREETDRRTDLGMRLLNSYNTGQ